VLRVKVLISILFAAILGVAPACGGDDGDGDGGDAGTTSTEESTTTLDPAQAEADITEVFTTFFDGTNEDYEHKLTLLEDPDAIADLYESARTDPEFAPLLKQVQADVQTITPTSDTEADVDFAILLNGAPATEGTQLGRAVLVDGEWRIANSTVCSLLALGNPEYNQDPACAVS
jgi:hypothetical protein